MKGKHVFFLFNGKESNFLSSKQIEFWLGETQNRQRHLFLKDASRSEKSETDSSSSEYESFHDMYDEVISTGDNCFCIMDLKENCTHFKQCSPCCLTPADLSKIVWNIDFQNNTKTSSESAEKGASNMNMTHSGPAIEAGQSAKDYCLDFSVSNIHDDNDAPSEKMHRTNAKRSGVKTIQILNSANCGLYLKIVPMSAQHSLNGIDSRLYKTLLDTLQRVTCYQKPYFDFSEIFPFQRFTDNLFTHLMKQGHTDLAFMTQMHKFHRPLPFYQYGLKFPQNDSNSKNSHTGKDQVKALKQLHKKMAGHDLKAAHILSGQIHTQFVHAYLQQKKFGKASRHLLEARQLMSTLEPSEFSGWFYLTEAMYLASLPKTGKNYRQQTMNSLQKARDRLLQEKERGKNFSNECCLILWWMLVTLTQLTPFTDLCNNSIRELRQKSRLLETWRILSLRDKETCKQILEQFRRELPSLNLSDVDKLNDDVLPFIQFFEKLCKSEQTSGKKLQVKQSNCCSFVLKNL